MKYSKLLFTSVFFFFFPLIFSGCNPYGCGNTKSKPYYNIQAMRCIVLDKSTRLPYSSVNATTLEKFLIYIESTQVSFYAMQGYVQNNLLMACDPNPNGSEGSKEIIKSIKITSNNAFSVDFPAGTELSSQFLMNMYSNDYDICLECGNQPITPTTVFIERTNLDVTFPLDQVANKKAKAYFSINLKNYPTASKSHIFTIEYEHLDSEKFTFVTQNINFL